MNRRKIVAGNWKMNKDLFDGMRLASELISDSSKLPSKSVEVIIFPPFPFLHTSISMAKRVEQITVGAQNCHHERSGAFTGEVSPSLLKSMEIDYVIIGHSERRTLFNESDSFLLKKLISALNCGLKVIFCIGESLDIREKGHHLSHIKDQLEKTVFKLDPEVLPNLVIAYEPIWAIGTGVNATAEQAQEMHHHIRQLLVDHFSEGIAIEMPVLYGGSVKPAISKELFSQPDVDGALVGGASLDRDSFMEIVAHRIKNN